MKSVRYIFSICQIVLVAGFFSTQAVSAQGAGNTAKSIICADGAYSRPGEDYVSVGRAAVGGRRGYVPGGV